MNRLELRFFAENFAHTWIAAPGLDEQLLAKGIDLASYSTKRDLVLLGITRAIELDLVSGRSNQPWTLRGLVEQLKVIVPNDAVVKAHRHTCVGAN